MKKNISGTDESEFEDLDVNKVETALKSVGVQLRDTTGQIRDFDDIIVDLGEKWDGLSRNAQRYVATISAGSRQQSRFIALLDDFDRTKELMDIAADSAGKADEQFAKYADTMEYKLNQLSTEWEKFKTGIIEEHLFKNAIDSLTDFIEKLNEIDFNDKFNIGGAVANIGLMITGITKTIALMKTAASGSGALFTKFKGDLPSIIGNERGKQAYKKEIAKIELIPTLNEKTLTAELEKLENDLIQKRARYQQLLQITPTLSAGEKALMNYNGNLTQNRSIDTFVQSAGLTADEANQFKTLLANIQETEPSVNSLTEAFIYLKSQLDQQAPAINQQEQELNQLGQEIDEEKVKLQHLDKELDNNSAARERNNKKIVEGINKADAAATKANSTAVNLAKGGLSLLSSGISTTLTYLPMMASGLLSVKDGLKAAGVQFGIMAIQQQSFNFLQAFSIALDKQKEVSTEGLTIANLKLAAAEAAAAAPIAVIVLGITALVAAIAGAIYIYKKWADAHDEVKIATKQLADEQERLKKVQEQRVQTKAEKNSTKKELEETTKLKDEWIELSQVKNKTTEQQEQESKLIEEVKEKFPEIINYYDEVNNKLDLSIEKWEKIIEKQKEAAEKAAKNDYIVATAEAKQSYNTQIAQADVDNIKNPYANVDTNNYLVDFSHLSQIRQTAKRTLLGTTNIGSQLDYDSIRQGLINLGLTDEFIELFSEVEGYNLKTLDGIKDFIKGEELTQGEINSYLEKYRDRIKEIKNANSKYTQEIQDANSSLEEANRIALETYVSSIENNTTNAKVLVAYLEENKKEIDYADFYSKYSEGFTAGTQGLLSAGSYDQLTKVGLDTLQAFGIKTEEDFKALDIEILTAYIQAAIDASQNDDLLNTAKNNLSEVETNALESVLTGSLNLTQRELAQRANKLKASGGEINNAYAKVYLDLYDDLNNAQEKLVDIYGKRIGTDYGQEIKTFVAASQNILDTFGVKNNEGDLKTQGETFLSSIGSILYKLGPELASAVLNENFYKNYNPLDEEGFRNSLEKVLTETGKKTEQEAKGIINDISNAAKDSGIISDQINVGDIEAYAEKVIKVQEAFKDVREELYNLSQQGKENVVISADQLENYEKLEAALKEAGVSDVKLLNKETGEWTLNVQKANELLEKYGEDAIQKLRDRQGKEALEMIELERRVAVLDDEEKARYAALLANSKEYEKQIELIEAAADKTAVMVNYLSQISALSGSVSGALSNFVKNKILSSSDIASLQKGFAPYGIDANQFINKNLGLTNPEQLYRTALAQLQNAIKSGKLNKDELLQAKAEIASLYASWIDYLQAVQDEEDKLAETEKKNAEDKEKLLEKITEAEKKLRKQEEKNAKDRQKDLDNIKKAEEDVVKAQEEYQKQLEQIEEKQKAINDAIEKYNELLYGSANRKGKLDIFYNYEQAISSLNDTLSRTEEKLGSAQDINAAVDALSRYTTATRNLIATEKAKQVSIQAGLANYANMIENGTASYTNRETGQQIGIRFGDYARKDQATGKYILNQRLLNQASFNDSFKDLIEENIETYNKYLDEYNKIEDEVAKKEKELQDKRKQALKQYSEFEKSIAEALKAQYENEVEDLKDKYDSMKAADDDYLSALEDAINKQRQLREKEQKYEDLAEQEKKLSLLQRDTSGSRTLDVNKLRKDVEKTRKQLLDEAVDEVVDGLKKLAKENEETRQVEMELKDAIIQNTNHWQLEAEKIAPTFTDANSYANYMAGLNPEFQEMSFAQQQVQLEEYKEQFSQMVEYQAWNLLDATSKSGDAIIDVIDISSETIMSIVSEKTTAFSEEVIRSYNEISQKVQDDLKNSEEAIDNARDALQDAIDKLDELQEKINEAIEKVAEMQKAYQDNEAERAESLADAQKALADAQKDLIEKQTELAKEQAKQAAENSKKDLSDIVPSDSEINPSSVIPDTTTSAPNSTETVERKYGQNLVTHSYHPSMEGKTLDEVIDQYNRYFDEIKAKKAIGENTNQMDGALYNTREVIMDLMGLKGYNTIDHINTLLKGQGKTPLQFAKGGLVNYTGPAWVDGTPARPEAFLSAADTKAIGDAVRILSDLSIIRNYDNLGSITNNTVGDTSIEINLNIESLSSEIDIENMLERVKEEIVSVANPIGINTILKQS